MYHVAGKETAGAHLLTMHNVHYLLHLMGSIRTAIMQDNFPDFIRKFFMDLYQEKSKFPEWAVGALKRVNVDLLA